MAFEWVRWTEERAFDRLCGRLNRAPGTFILPSGAFILSCGAFILSRGTFILSGRTFRRRGRPFLGAPGFRRLVRRNRKAAFLAGTGF
jgi:hypothetical protein